jgi:hypothetical protein
MNEWTEHLNVYEAPILVEIGAFTDLTRGGLLSESEDILFARF